MVVAVTATAVAVVAGVGRDHRAAVQLAAAVPPAPAAAPSTVPAPGAAAAGEDLSPGRYHEEPDTGNYIVRRDGASPLAGSASSVVPGTERLRFDVTVRDDGDHGTFAARLVNVSGRTMRFPTGVHVLADVRRDGQPWRTFVVDDPATTVLAPGRAVSVSSAFAFAGPGEYAAWGSTEVALA